MTHISEQPQVIQVKFANFHKLKTYLERLYFKIR